MMEFDKTNVHCVFNDFTVGPCKGLNCLQKGLARNPRGLIRLMGKFDLLGEVLLGFYCSPNATTGFWLLNLKTLMYPNRVGGATTLDPRHYFSLSMIEKFVGAVCILRYSDSQFSLVANIGKNYLYHFQVLIILVENFNL